jgi:hypothetical protein
MPFQNPPLSSSTGTGTLYMSLLARGAPARFVFSILLRAADDPDVRELFVDRLPVVVEAGRLEDDAGRAHHHRHCEDPQKQAVQHHRNVLPVLLSLQTQSTYIYTEYHNGCSYLPMLNKTETSLHVQ